MEKQTKEQIQNEIAKLQDKVKQIEAVELAKANKQSTLIIKELKIEVETKLHTEINRVSKIVIPSGWRLLELSELIFIYNNYQNKFNWGSNRFFDEITNQPIKNCKYPYWNAWLHRLDVDDQSGLGGNNLDLSYDNVVRGVRFCRDIKEIKA